METRTRRLSEVPLKVRAASDYTIRSEWFSGFGERQLGNAVGMTQFGVNEVTLEPGAYSALRHWHEAEDEFVLVLSGELILIDESGEHLLTPGVFAGFPAGAPNAHHLTNRSSAPATYLAVGSRRPGQETIHYPDDPLGPIRK